MDHHAPLRRGPGAGDPADPGEPGVSRAAPDLDALLSDIRATAGPGALVAEVDGARLGAAEVEHRVARLAGGIRAAGVAAGDVVAWQVPNGIDAALLPRACWRLGAVAAPLHPRAGAADVAHACSALAPRLVLARRGTPLAGRAGTRVLDPAPADAWPDAEPIARPAAPAAGPEAIAAILFTSGSSGPPKAVLHARGALAGKARSMVGVHGLGPEDAVLMPAPLAHVSGLLNGILVPGAVPCRSVLMDRWDPERALAAIEAEQVTFMVGPPTFFVALMDAPGFDPARVASLRLVSCGGAGVTEAFVREASARLGAVVKRTYGSTEAPTVATAAAGDDPDRVARHDGRPIGGAELSVRDPASGDRLPAGEAGELWVRGPELFRGYLDPADTDAVMRDGWFRTGDLATIDGEGWLTVVGRLKDVVIRGGENISTSEVEAVLEAHPAVRQAVVVGYPDRRLGERVCAFLVAPETIDLESVRSWFAQQGVARFKTPEAVVTVGAVPLLASGKPDRRALQAEATRRFGGGGG